MRLNLIAGAFAALVLAPAVSAHAVGVKLTAFDTVIAEGARTATIDGSDVTGFQNGSTQNDILSVQLGALNAGDDILIVGQSTASNTDMYLSGSATGIVNISVLNAIGVPSLPDESFMARVYLLVDNVVTQSMKLNGTGAELLQDIVFDSFVANDQALQLRFFGISGVTNYDALVSVSPSAVSSRVSGQSPVPLPATLPLLAGSLAAFGLVRRRTKKA